MDERYHEIVKRQATDEEVKGCRIYGQQALDYTKRELVAMLIFMGKKREEDAEFHSRGMQLLIDLRKARNKL